MSRIQQGRSKPPKKGRPQPPPGDKGKGKRPYFNRETTPRGLLIPSWARRFYEAVQNLLADTPVAAPGGSSTTIPPEVTPDTDTQIQSTTPGTDAQTNGATA
uniref:Uncharacterized protein n=1 Tax=Solanum tuberosum TaxID=4113 RepID=M1DQF5_SOLTU